MIKFEEIYFSNFLSFYGDHYFSFANKGFHHIEGFNLDEVVEENEEEVVSIGSGKTSFTFVIQYALFGMISKKLDKKDKIINKKVKKNLKVQLVFKTNNEKYRITRYRKHDEHNNNLYLEIYSIKNKQWIDLTETSNEDTQNSINNIIEISSETFLKTILYSREDEKQFFKLTQSERIKIIENIIQLNKFNKYLKKIKSKIKKNNEELIEAEKEETGLKKAIKIHQKNADDEKKEVDKNIKLVKKHLEKLKTLNKTYNFDLFDTLNKNIKNIKQELKELNYETIIILDPTSTENMINNLTKEIKNIEIKIEKIEPITCKECGAVQDQEDYNNRIKELQETQKSRIKELNEYEEELEQVLKIIPEQLQKKEIQDNLKEKLKEQLDKFEKELEDNFEDLLDLTYDEIEELRIKQDLINQYEKDLKAFNYKKSEEHLKKAEKEEKKLNKIKKQINELLENKKMLSWWEEALDMKNENSIKSFIISQIIPVLNNILKNNLNYIFNGNLSIYIDNSLKEKIYKNDVEYDYFELSSGEKLKVNFATNFSIFDMTKINLTSSNLIFFDDVFINIDLPTTLKFLNLINDKYANNAAIYLISHDKNVVDNISPLTHTIIKKKNDISYIE